MWLLSFHVVSHNSQVEPQLDSPEQKSEAARPPKAKASTDSRGHSLSLSLFTINVGTGR